VHAAALFDLGKPKFKQSPVNDHDISDILLGTIQRVICSTPLAQSLLARKKTLLSYDAEQRAKAPKAKDPRTKIVPFREVTVVGHSKLMYALTQPEDAQGHYFHASEGDNGVTPIFRQSRPMYELHHGLWLVVRLALQQRLILKIRSGKKVGNRGCRQFWYVADEI